MSSSGHIVVIKIANCDFRVAESTFDPKLSNCTFWASNLQSCLTFMYIYRVVKGSFFEHPVNNSFPLSRPLSEKPSSVSSSKTHMYACAYEHTLKGLLHELHSYYNKS